MLHTSTLTFNDRTFDDIISYNEFRPKSNPLPTEEITVLDFFNKCDRITLRKLRSKVYHLVKLHDDNVMKRDILSKRYKDIYDVYSFTTGVTPTFVPFLAGHITELKEREEKFVGLWDLFPQLTNESVKDLDEVVVVDIELNEIAWVVEKRDRTIVDVQQEILFQKFSPWVPYCHQEIRTRLTQIVQMIPESSVYLICIPKRMFSQRNSRFQTAIFSLMVLLLNMRSQKQLDGLILQEDGTYYHVEDKIGNRVYMLTYRSLDNYYDIFDLMNKGLDFSRITNMRENPFEGLKYSAEIEEKLSKGRGCRQLTKCVVTSDAFCRSLMKKLDKFPYMYK